MAISYFHNPVEEAVKSILQGSHLQVAPNQYMPWLDVQKLSNMSAFPVVSCATLKTRVDSESIYADTDVLIAIYDLLPQPDYIQEPGALALQAAITANRYQTDLLQITDILGNVDEESRQFEEEDYCWVSQRIFQPLYREDLYNTKEAQASHILSDKLYAATVTGTIRGRVNHICCTPKFAEPLTPEVVSFSQNGANVTLYLRGDDAATTVNVYEATGPALIFSGGMPQGRTVSVQVTLANAAETDLIVEYTNAAGTTSEQVTLTL